MSNFIPMVSSSPPPMDDGGGFDDWEDDDDFGTFTGASNNTQFPSNNGFDVWQNQSSEVSDPAQDDFGNFANFESFSEKNENENIYQNDVDIKSKPLGLDLEKTTTNVITNNLDICDNSENIDQDRLAKVEKEQIGENKPDVLTRHTTQDSGICSTDISPSPKLDETGSLQDKISKSDGSDLYGSHSDDSLGKDMSDINDVNSADKHSLCEGSDLDISETDYNDAVLVDKNNLENRDLEVSETDFSNIASMSDNIKTESDLSVNVKQPDPLILDKISDSDTDSKNMKEDLAQDNSSQLDNAPSCDNEIKGDNKASVLNHSSSQSSLENVDMDHSNTDSHLIENKLVKNTEQSSSETCIPPSTVPCDMSDLSSTEGDEEKSETDTCTSTAPVTSTVEELSTLKDSGIDMAETVIGKLKFDSECERNSDGSIESDIKNDVKQNELSDNIKNHDNQNNPEFQSPDEQFCDTEELTNEKYDSEDAGKSSHSENNSASESASGSHSPVEFCDEQTNLSDEKSENISNSDTDVVKDEICFEKEFPVILNLRKDSCNEGDKDDDFADFQSGSESVHSENLDSNGNEFPSLAAKDESDDDDFGGFSGTTDNKDDSSWGFQDTTADNDGDDWAAFQEPVASSAVEENKSDDDDDEFGDFGDFSESTEFVSAPKPQENISDTSVKSEPFTAKVFSRQRKVSESVVDSVVEEMFKDTHDMGYTPLSSLSMIENCLKLPKVSTTTISTNKQKKDNLVLWTKLQNLNTTTALHYQWTESNVNKKLFSTLKIDTQNILLGHRKQSVPIYASNLTMLEPMKGPVAPKPNSEPQLVDTESNKSDQLQNITTDIPPVQFDWTTSGLTNPLEENRKALGLDFLVVQEAEGAIKANVLSGDHAPHDTRTSLQPLENILATLKVSSTVKKAKNTENLSQEAAKIITSLPNLSFMQAKVLMFPLRQQNN